MKPRTESSKQRATTRALTLMMVALLAIGLAIPTAARAQTWGQYGVSILPMPPGNYLFGLSPVNDAGQVTGGVYVANKIYHAFLYNGTVTNDLGTLGGSFSEGLGINASGDVTGWADINSGATHAFLYNGATMTDLGTLGGAFSGGNGINASGEVAGYGQPASGPSTQDAFLYDGTTMKDLGTTVGETSQFSVGMGINQSGEVTGYDGVQVGTNIVEHAFLYNGTMMNDLGTLGGSYSEGLGINASGEVTGWSTTTNSGATHAFLYNGTTMTDLGTLGGGGSEAFGISDAGDAVGYAIVSSKERAALWEGGTGYFLDAIVGSGWTFSFAQGISPGGTILALGANRAINNGSPMWAVLKPNAAPSTVTPEPASILLLATGLIGLAGVSIGKAMVGSA